MRQIVPRARILPAVHGEVPLNLLLGVGQYKLDLAPARTHHDHKHDASCGCEHDHGAAFQSWSYTNAQPFGVKALRDLVLSLPAAVFRAKGLLYLAEAPLRRAVLQVVGPRVSVTLGEPWGEEPPCTHLVFLSTPGDLDTTALQVALNVAWRSYRWSTWLPHSRPDS